MAKYSKEVLEAYQKAVEIREKAYAPYSKFKVGVALKFTDDKKYYLGHNVENASYPACTCAENVALANASIHHGLKNFEFMVLVTDTEDVAAPCGICRQKLCEFVPAEFPIYLSNLKGIQKTVTLKEILPYQFNKLS
ncbi:MAG: cytidine deaminase [Bacteriovoracaceae bacterium]|nr:cytidine deaminase [Bacteriovoracaceae bacterium]